MADAKPWKFTQIGGDRKVLVLAGMNAPHGRPRRSPVVEDEIALRDSETYYSGAVAPTRHIFGDAETDWHLVGRFADSYNGPNGARALATQIKQMVRDAQTVRIEWGDIVAATGILRRFKASRESEAEIAWTLTVGIDSDDTLPIRRPTQPSQGRALIATAILQAQVLAAAVKVPDDLEIEPGFLESIDNTVASIRAAFGQIVGVANDLDNFERAAFSKLTSLRAAVGQLSTAVDTLRGTLESTENDFAISRGGARSGVRWGRDRAEAVFNAIVLAALLADIDRQAEIAQGGAAYRTHVAKQGDSWEQISTTYYGGPSKADNVRQANGAQYGAKPRPGRVVLIPKV